MAHRAKKLDNGAPTSETHQKFEIIGLHTELDKYVQKDITNWTSKKNGKPMEEFICDNESYDPAKHMIGLENTGVFVRTSHPTNSPTLCIFNLNGRLRTEFPTPVDFHETHFYYGTLQNKIDASKLEQMQTQIAGTYNIYAIGQLFRGQRTSCIICVQDTSEDRIDHLKAKDVIGWKRMYSKNKWPEKVRGVVRFAYVAEDELKRIMNLNIKIIGSDLATRIVSHIDIVLKGDLFEKKTTVTTTTGPTIVTTIESITFKQMLEYIYVWDELFKTSFDKLAEFEPNAILEKLNFYSEKNELKQEFLDKYMSVNAKKLIETYNQYVRFKTKTEGFYHRVYAGVSQTSVGPGSIGYVYGK